MSTPMPLVAGAGAIVVPPGVVDTDAEAASGDGAIVGTSSGAPIPPPGVAPRSSASIGSGSCRARVPSVVMGGPLFIGHSITDAMRQSMRQKLCRYNNL